MQDWVDVMTSRTLIDSRDRCLSPSSVHLRWPCRRRRAHIKDCRRGPSPHHSIQETDSRHRTSKMRFLSGLSLAAMVLLVVVQLFDGPSSVEALTCPKCEPENKARICPQLTASDCPHGLTTDMCGCCDKCYKDMGDECGGIWGQGGTCAEVYECAMNPINEQLPGKCVEKP